MARNKEKQNIFNKSISSLIKMNATTNELLDTNSKILNGDTNGRQNELDNIYTQFQNIVRSDSNSIMNNKSSKDNVFDYLLKNVFQLDPTDPKSYNKIEKIFTGGDASVSSYFMGNNNDYISLCDQIESICAYLYQLEEAIDVIRDNVLAAEEANEEVSMDITFSDITDDTTEYIEHIKKLADDHRIPTKLKDHVAPKCIKFGKYYVITMPYSEIYNKMAGSINKKDSSKVVKEFVEVDFINDGMSKDTLKENKVILENASKIKIYDEVVDSIPVLEEFLPIMEESIDSAILREISKANRRKRDVQYTTKQTTGEDTTILDSKLDLNTDDNLLINGCFVKMVDPRYMVPIKIFDHIIGYYYFENFDNALNRTNTSITEIMSGQFNFNENNSIIDNIVEKVLKNLKYKDIVQGSNQFKSLILNSLMFKESRENMLNIKFIPAEYVVEFSTNEDEKGNGRPVLLRSLFFGRLYVSLLNFNITTLITKSTDTEFYYLKEGIDGQYSNQISDVINQMRSSNIDPSAIMNGDLMHGNRAIYKRYFTPLNESGEKPFEIDVVSGQKIDLHDEFMDKLLKFCIGSTGVPSTMIDNLDEADYAIMVAQHNIKHLRRCISIQSDFNPAITQLYKNIAKYSNTQTIKPEILETMKITLRKPKVQHANYSADAISTSQSTAEAMVSVHMKGQNAQLTELDELVKEELMSSLVKQMTSQLPWNLIESEYERALLRARERQVDTQTNEEME